MFRLNHWVATAALLIAATAASAAPAGVVVRLSAPAPLLRGDVDVVVNVSVTNTNRSAVSVLRWELPTERPENAAFRITRDGQPVAYTGRLVKRGTPTADDYVRIEAGATLDYAVELTAAYDLSRSGNYAVEYSGKGVQGDAGTPLRSDALYLWLESRSGRGAAIAVPAPASLSGGTTDAVTFTGNCSASRQATLLESVAAATTYSNQSVAYFNGARSATQRYFRWFGGGQDRARFSTAKTHFVAIQEAFVNRPITLDCSCTESYYAYVFANQPYKIYLCNAFWSAPMTGTDSKAGTLIHEMSHFTVVVGTGDYAYGQSAAAALAINNPAQALMNADSHEYFAENTPVLP